MSEFTEGKYKSQNGANTALDTYAIYLRKSRTDSPGESVEEVVERHKSILTDHAARKGLYIGEIYQEVVSGETIKARPQIQRLIQDCYDGKYKGILVVEVTRLSRGNQGDAQTILDCLKFGNHNKGVQVITPTKVYDVAHNAEDEEYMEFELFMSRREYKMINKRMDRGRKQCVVEGQYMGSYRPYGYDIFKTKEIRTLKPNPDEAPIVKKIYEWTVKDHMTAWEVAKRLTAMGVPTYKGGKEWSRDSIKIILTNPTYTGKVRWNDRMVVRSMENGELVKRRPRSVHTDQYMLYNGLHDGIIDDETFKAASEQFYSDKTKANLQLINPLAGLIFCKGCGRTMVYNDYRQRPNTEPRFMHKQSTLCKCKSAKAGDVYDALVHTLRLYIEDFEVKVNSDDETTETDIKAQTDLLLREQRSIEKKLAKLFEAWEEDTITNNEFVERKAVHNEKLEAIKAEIAILENSVPEKEKQLEMIASLHKAIESIQDLSISPKLKNQYLKQVIKRIEFSRENDHEFILDVQLQDDGSVI